MIEQGIQSRSKNQELRTYGCFFYCICKVAEVASGQHLDDKDCELRFRLCKERGLIGDDAMILNHAAIFNYLTSFINFKYYKSFNMPNVLYYIEENIKTGLNGKVLTHFTAMINGVKFDPLDPNRPTNTGYSVHTYRWFE